MHFVTNFHFTIGSKDLDKVIKGLQRLQFAFSEWRELGLQLGLYDSTIKDIDEECRGVPKKCLPECLAAWLREEDKVRDKGAPSWTALAQGMDDIGNHRIAAEIRNM